jgi:hypothetical protein
MPDLENLHQPSVNHCWSYIVGNLGCHMLHTVINEVLAAFIGQMDSETLIPLVENVLQ